MKIINDDGIERELSDKEKDALNKANGGDSGGVGWIVGGFAALLVIGLFFSVVKLLFVSIAFIFGSLPAIGLLLLIVWLVIKIRR